MSNKKAISNLLVAVNRMVGKLTDEELKLLETGKFELILNDKTKGKKASGANFDTSKIVTINKELDLAKSREEGLQIINSYLKTKSELEIFAKKIDVAVMKSDKVESIKNNIVDATVGARLRSGAIQGKVI